MGSQIIQDNFEKVTEKNKDEVVEGTKAEVMNLLRQTIRPEFLNRVDEVIMFQPLMKKEIRGIINIQLDNLKKLVAQDLFLGRDQRVLAESLARGRVAVMIGNSYYSYLPFLKAGLPIKTLPLLKEGNYGTGGSGNLAIIKAPARPNSTKVFVNWLLGREGQEIVSRALGQATRRLDVDTRFLKESGTIAAKDAMPVNEFLKIENQSEEKLDKVREPASKFAHSILK
jgi:ABC-type glycerol-3-phosphate transport system substrate-binding protein